MTTIIGSRSLSGQNGRQGVVLTDACQRRGRAHVIWQKAIWAGRAGSGGDLLTLLPLCRIAATGRRRVALPGESEALLAASMVRGRSVFGIKGRTRRFLLDVCLGDAILLGGFDGVGRASNELASPGVVVATIELGRRPTAAGVAAFGRPDAVLSP